MATAAHMAMNTDLLTLAQWLSPAYPLGSFAYSHGLEAAIAAEDVTDKNSLTDWLTDILRHGTGWCDALFLAAAFHAKSAEAVADLDLCCLAMAPSAERRIEMEGQGVAFCKVTAQVWDMDIDLRAFPVAVGRAARLAGLALSSTSEFYLHAFQSNLLAAAQRLMPLGQTKAQQILRDLAPLCREIADSTQDGDLERLTSTAFLADIASMKHETQYARIFRT